MGAFKDWIDSLWGKQAQIKHLTEIIPKLNNIELLENFYKTVPAEFKTIPAVKTAYDTQKSIVADIHAGIQNPLRPVILNMLTDWKKAVAKYDLDDPKDADKKLAGLAADVLGMSAAAAVVELTLGALPNDAGTVASTKVSDIMAWLGFGAVVTAVAHDPVKIGLLRPYQDSLEAHFRNRRPSDMALFQAYKTRELTESKPTLEQLNDDSVIDRIENENEKYYMREIAKWGYSEWFAGALARSATNTLNFGALTALARQGLLTRGLAAYSLWGSGLDRMVMKPALDALMVQNKISNYEGFRAQIEPAYVEGIVTEQELTDYWSKINVPADVQAAMIPRFRKKREAYIKKQTDSPTGKERDLTISQIQAAYQNDMIDKPAAQNMIIGLSYSLDEAKILLSLADLRRKLPNTGNLKRLPLSDYEKAFKNQIIKKDVVLDRMKGEYTAFDIDLESRLLDSGKA